MMCSDSLNVTSLGSGAVKAQWTIAFTLRLPLTIQATAEDVSALAL